MYILTNDQAASGIGIHAVWTVLDVRQVGGSVRMQDWLRTFDAGERVFPALEIAAKQR
jgi:hypothetical protein